MGFFRRKKQPLIQNLADQTQELNALRYNTAQAGSVIPLVFGTVRQQVNLIAFTDFKETDVPVPGAGGGGGKKGGKGGGGGKKGGGKTTAQTMKMFSVDVDFGICQGPVIFRPDATVWSGAAKTSFAAAPWNFYEGDDGQAADPVFAGLGDTVGYSGTYHVTQTPMNLGSTPTLPNVSFETSGFGYGTAGANFPLDANPGEVVYGALTDSRYGAGFPLANLAETRAVGANTYGDYCQAVQFAVSFSLDGQTQAQEWLAGLADMTNTAVVWSGGLLKFVPYGDLGLASNEATWEPNLVPEYSLTDDDFLPWSPRGDGAPALGDDDPVLITRSNPADAVNWLTIEYLDRNNSYNQTIIPVFDQGAIDTYGLRTGDDLHGHLFCDPYPAQVSAQLRLQRLQYIRNTYKFKLGWQFGLLEPMDIVLLTERSAGIVDYPVRILAIEEDENGDLTFEAEQIQTGVPAPVASPTSAPSVDFPVVSFLRRGPGTAGDVIGSSDGPLGTFAAWINPSTTPLVPGNPQGLIVTNDVPTNRGPALSIGTEPDGSVVIVLSTGTGYSTDHHYVQTAAGTVVPGSWHNILVSWNTQSLGANRVDCYVDGSKRALTIVSTTGTTFDVGYSTQNYWSLYTFGNSLGILDSFFGCTNGVWFTQGTRIDLSKLSNRRKFIAPSGRAVDLGPDGSSVTGTAPLIFLRWDGSMSGPNATNFEVNYGTGGDFQLQGGALTACASTPY